MMTQAIKAKYVGNGIFELLGQLDLPKGLEVTIHVEAGEKASSEMDDESRLWLETNLSKDLPSYNWERMVFPKESQCVMKLGEVLLLLITKWQSAMSVWQT